MTKTAAFFATEAFHTALAAAAFAAAFAFLFTV